MAQQIALVRSDGQEATLRPPPAQPTRRRALDGALEGPFACLSIWLGATIETVVLHSKIHVFLGVDKDLLLTFFVLKANLVEATATLARI